MFPELPKNTAAIWRVVKICVKAFINVNKTDEINLLAFNRVEDYSSHMKRVAVITSLVLAAASAGQARERAPTPLPASARSIATPAPATPQRAAVDIAARGASEWRGVGRLTAGRAFCTATLISRTQALTAAHCVYDKRTGARIPEHSMTFTMAGANGLVSRRVRQAALLDGHDFSPRPSVGAIGSDVALLELAEAVSEREAAGFDVGGSMRGDLTLVSYEGGVRRAPSISSDCRVGRSSGAVRAMSCVVGHGASGAPVFEMRDGRPKIVAIVSASGRADNRPATLAVAVEPLVAQLRRNLRQDVASAK